MAITLEELQVKVTAQTQSYYTAMQGLQSFTKTELNRLEKMMQSHIQNEAKMVAIGNTGFATMYRKRYDVALAEYQKFTSAYLSRLKTFERQVSGSNIMSPGKGGSGGGAGGNFMSQLLGGSNIGGAFMAGGAGGAAAAGVLALIGTLKQLGSEFVHLSGSAIDAAARFEITTNALTAMTGSASLAKRELAAIDEVARNTTGLRMEEAEQGYVRLRGLGFEAKVVTSLIQGLAKQKLLSGADDQSMQRVLVNLQQLSAGSARASMDIKEMVHAMPTLVGPMLEAFGTMNFGQVGKEFNKDPKAAMEKFSAAVEATTQAEGGLTNATDKFYDSWITVSRALVNDETLRIMATGLKDFNSYLANNQSTWVTWGGNIADVLQGVRNAWDSTANLLRTKKVTPGGDPEVWMPFGGKPKNMAEDFALSSYQNPWMTLAAPLIGLPAFAGQGIGLLTGALGRSGHAANQEKPNVNPYQGSVDQYMLSHPKVADAISKGKISADQMKGLGVDHDEQGRATFSLQKFFADLNRLWQDQIKAETRQFSELKENSQRYFEERENINKNHTEMVDAQIGSKLTFTVDQEAKQFELSAANQRQSLQTRKADLIAYYNDQIKAAKGTAHVEGEESKEVLALEEKKRNALRDIDTDITKQKYSEIRKRAEFAYKIQEQERKSSIEHYSLIAAGVTQSSEFIIKELERAMEVSVDTSGRLYDREIEQVQSSSVKILSALRASHALQLNDLTLVESEKANLRTKFAQEEAAIVNETSSKVIAIEQAKHEKIMSLIQKRYEFAGQRYKMTADLFSNLQGVDYENFSAAALAKQAKQVVENIQAGGSTGDKEPINDWYERAVTIMNARTKANLKYGESIAGLTLGTKEYNDAQAKFNDMLESDRKFTQDAIGLTDDFRASLKDVPGPMMEIVKALGAIGSSDAFDKLSQDMLKAKQRADLDEVNNRVRQQASLLLNTQLRDMNAAPQFKNPNLVKQAQLDYDKVLAERNLLMWQQSKEAAAAYAKTLDGLKERYAELSSGAADTTLRRIAEGELWSEKNALIASTRTLEMEYYKDSTLWALKKAEALAQVNRDIYEVEQEAIIRTEVALKKMERQMKISADGVRANVAEWLEAQTNMTDLVSEGLTGAMESWHDSIRNGFDLLMEKIGLADTALGKFISNFLSGMAEMVANKFFTWLLEKLLGAGKQPPVANTTGGPPPPPPGTAPGLGTVAESNVEVVGTMTVSQVATMQDTSVAMMTGAMQIANLTGDIHIGAMTGNVQIMTVMGDVNIASVAGKVCCGEGGGSKLAALSSMLIGAAGAGMMAGNARPRVINAASGSAVSGSSPYLVGERGPELFVPDSNGKILSNNDSRKLFTTVANKGGGSMIQNNFHFHANKESGAFSRESADQAIRKMIGAQQRASERGR